MSMKDELRIIFQPLWRGERMSSRIFPDDILFFQRLLKAEGFYGGELDGLWGPITERAVTLFEERAETIRANIGSFDQRSERNIATLALHAQSLAREFLGRALATGLRVKIISGTRTYEEQNALYRQERYGNPGPIVTCVRGGRSNHNFGIAWDIGIFTVDGGYLTDGSEYDEVAEHGIADGIEWGGHWRNFVDKPHYQVKMGVDLAEVRRRFESGEPYPMMMIA